MMTYCRIAHWFDVSLALGSFSLSTILTRSVLSWIMDLRKKTVQVCAERRLWVLRSRQFGVGTIGSVGSYTWRGTRLQIGPFRSR